MLELTVADFGLSIMPLDVEVDNVTFNISEPVPEDDEGTKAYKVAEKLHRALRFQMKQDSITAMGILRQLCSYAPNDLELMRVYFAELEKRMKESLYIYQQERTPDIGLIMFVKASVSNQYIDTETGDVKDINVSDSRLVQYKGPLDTNLLHNMIVAAIKNTVVDTDRKLVQAYTGAIIEQAIPQEVEDDQDRS